MAGQQIGYVRVGTLDRNGNVNWKARFWTGSSRTRPRQDTERPELTGLLRFSRDGDTVVVHSMDWLARDLVDLRALVQGLTCRGVRVDFVKESLVFTGEDSPHDQPHAFRYGRLR